MKCNLRSAANNKFVCADDQVLAVDHNGKPIPGSRVLVPNRDNPGLWETFYPENVEYSPADLQNLANLLAPYLPQPAPTPPGPTPNPPPNGHTTVPGEVPYEVYATGQYNLATKVGCCSFTEECARRLHAIDPGWGHVRKTSGQESCARTTQSDLHAVDAVFNKNIPECRDIIVSSGVPGAAPGWNITGTPPASLWMAPL